jgi:hypothetical protein
MSTLRWTPAFRGLIKDPFVQEEFDRLSAQLRGAFDDHTIEEAEKGLITGQTVDTLPSTDAGDEAQPGIRWLDGPWLLNADGDTAGNAVIRPPIITVDQNDYAPLGIDTCIGMALTSDADRSITGIKIAARQTRLLYILNAGLFNLTLPHESANSQGVHRFGMGATGDTLILPPKRVVWLFYDVAPSDATNARWRLFAIPGIPLENLPGSLTSGFQDVIEGDLAFPPDFDWGGAKLYDGITAAGIGEPAPTLTGAGTPLSTVWGNFRLLSTAAVIGANAGLTSGGSSLVNMQHNPTITFWVYTGGDLSSQRIWIVLTNTALQNTDDLQAVVGAAEYIGFRYSTTSAFATWVAVSSDATGQDVTDTGVPVVVSSVYKLKIRTGPTGSMLFSVNDGVELVVTQRFPQPTTQLFWSLMIFTQVGGARTLGWARTFWKSINKFTVFPYS